MKKDLCTESATVSAEAQSMVLAAMTAPKFPERFVLPLPSRPEQLPNLKVYDNTRNYQASVLQIRRPMSAEMCHWAIACFAKAGPASVTSYSVALELRDAYCNVGAAVPASLTAKIADLKGPKSDRELKLETRVVFGPAVMCHARASRSLAVTAVPPLSAKTFAQWDAKCWEVYGKSVGLSLLLSPATVVYNNLELSAEDIRTSLLANLDQQVAKGTVPEPAGELAPVGKRPRVQFAEMAPNELGASAEPASVYGGSRFQWVNASWMEETDVVGNTYYHHKDCLPAGAKQGARKLPPSVPWLDGGSPVKGGLMPRYAAAARQPAAPTREQKLRASGVDDMAPLGIKLLPAVPGHDLMLPAGETLEPRPAAEQEWRLDYGGAFEV